MNFLERIADSEFRISRNGETVFSPWGSAFTGKIIPNKAEEERVRGELAKCYRNLLVGVSLPMIVLMVSGQVLVSFLWGLVGSIWFLVMRISIVWKFQGTMSLLPLPRRNDEAGEEVAGVGFGLVIAMFCGAIAFAMFYSATLSASPVSGAIGGSVFAGFAAFALYAIVRNILS